MLHGAGCRGLIGERQSRIAADRPTPMRGCSCSAACPATPRSPRGAIMLIRPTSSGGCSARAIGEELQALDYEERLERLAERRIGLWDVIASASRPRQPRPGDPRRGAQSDRASTSTTFPELRAIAFNGAHGGAGRAQADRRAAAGRDAHRPAVIERGQHAPLRREGASTGPCLGNISDRQELWLAPRVHRAMIETDDSRRRRTDEDRATATRSCRWSTRRWSPAPSPTPTACW